MWPIKGKYYYVFLDIDIWGTRNVQRYCNSSFLLTSALLLETAVVANRIVSCTVRLILPKPHLRARTPRLPSVTTATPQHLGSDVHNQEANLTSQLVGVMYAPQEDSK